VTTVHHLEKGNLRVAGQIDVLRAVGHQLHKSSTHGRIIF
jgi:hypothetical protein